MVIALKVQVREDDQHFAQVVALDGIQYKLSTYWSKADDRWYLDVQDALGNALVRGLGLTAGTDLLYPYRARSSCPPGKLFVRLSDGQTDDPTHQTFWQGLAVLYYQEAAS